MCRILLFFVLGCCFFEIFMWIRRRRSHCLPSSNKTIRCDKGKNGKVNTRDRDDDEKARKIGFLKWIRYVSGARKQKQNQNKIQSLSSYLFSEKTKSHTNFFSLSPVIPADRQKTKNTQNKFRKTGWKFYDRVRSFCFFFFAHCLYSSFFVLGYHLINKMAKKKVFRRRWRRFFFLVWFYFILFFLRENIQTSFVFLCWSCAARFLWKKGGVHRLFDCNWIFVGERRRQLPYKII